MPRLTLLGAGAVAAACSGSASVSFSFFLEVRQGVPIVGIHQANAHPKSATTQMTNSTALRPTLSGYYLVT